MSNPNNKLKGDKKYIEELSSLLEEVDYKWFSNFSMSPFGLITLATEIQSHKRKQIIEFGSGASSFVMSRSILKYTPDAKIISIESDPYYCDDLNDFAHDQDLDDVIQFIYAPLYPCPFFRGKWYDYTVLKTLISKYDKLDMVVIDGPPAWKEKIKLSRYGAIPFIKEHLAENYSIFLDDANRQGENMIIKMWEEQYEMVFEILKNRLAICRTE